MSNHQAEIHWHRNPSELHPGTYSRNHTALLNGQQTIHVSASTEYKGDPGCADPEQLLVSAVASCHMLTFLAIAELQGYVVERYQDTAVGSLEKVHGGVQLTRVELTPRVVFGGDKVPDVNALNCIHAGAHKNCFIGRSIKAEVIVLPEPSGH